MLATVGVWDVAGLAPVREDSSLISFASVKIRLSLPFDCWYTVSIGNIKAIYIVVWSDKTHTVCQVTQCPVELCGVVVWFTSCWHSWAECACNTCLSLCLSSRVVFNSATVESSLFSRASFLRRTCSISLYASCTRRCIVDIFSIIWNISASIK